jgi:hypothetical protein
VHRTRKQLQLYALSPPQCEIAGCLKLIKARLRNAGREIFPRGEAIAKSASRMWEIAISKRSAYRFTISSDPALTVLQSASARLSTFTDQLTRGFT